jgi:transposase-like protein
MPDNSGMKNHNDARALWRRVEKERSATTGGRVRFSERLKDDATALLESQQWSGESLARAIGIAPSVLQRWVKKQQDPDAHQRKPKGGKLTRVAIVRSADGKSESDTLELELAGGAKVRGLTLEQLARLLEVTR